MVIITNNWWAKTHIDEVKRNIRGLRYCEIGKRHLVLLAYIYIYIYIKVTCKFYKDDIYVECIK